MKTILPLLIAAAGLFLAPARTGAAPDNLLLNPSFEYETAADFHSCVYWTLNQPDPHGGFYGSVRRENWRARDGYYAMAIRGTWAGAGDFGGFWQEVPAAPDATCRFSAWTWTDAAWTAQTCEIKIEFWNADHSRMIEPCALPLKNTGESWQESVLEATAPAETAWVRVVVNIADAGPEGSLLVDSVALRINSGL